MNKYWAKFDENGRAISFAIEGIHIVNDADRAKYVADGFFNISDEDYNRYLGNYGFGENGTGYIRDSQTKKPVSAPPVSNSQKALLIRVEYEQELQNLKDAMMTAIINGDEELQNEIKSDYTELMSEYKSELERVIQNG